MHSSVFVPEYTVLEDDVRLGPFVVLTNTKYPFSPGAKDTMKGPTLKQGAILGANVTVLPGVIIGRKALIGAGAVVTKDVPEGTVVIGNPGRIVKTLSDLPY
jgi:acetyltransferase-like isoleucine patch superfamily enzyme